MPTSHKFERNNDTFDYFGVLYSVGVFGGLGWEWRVVHYLL